MNQVSTYHEFEAQKCFMELVSFLRGYEKYIERASPCLLILPPCEDVGILHPEVSDKALFRFHDSEIDIIIDGVSLLASVCCYDDPYERKCDVPEAVDETCLWSTEEAVYYLARMLNIDCLDKWLEYWRAN